MTSRYAPVVRERLRLARRPLWLRRPELHRSRFNGVLLVPTARYHVEELSPLEAALREKGFETTFVTTRAAPEHVREALNDYGAGPLYAWPRVFSAVPSFEAVVVMNDWGPTRRLIALARQRGVTTFAKVEGVQDFADVDTGRRRLPYRHADVVLAQGQNDRRALADAKNVRVVGNHRLEAIWHGPERSLWNRRRRPLAVINSNFTYGVLPNARERWVERALGAARSAGCEPLVSQHPAETRLPPAWPTTSRPMSQLLAEDADILVSRFSTVPFEAMARGVPFVYFKPREENVQTFATPKGAFVVAEGEADLADALRQSLDWRGTYRERASQFFLEQIDITNAATSAHRTAEVIAVTIANARTG